MLNQSFVQVSALYKAGVYLGMFSTLLVSDTNIPNFEKNVFGSKNIITFFGQDRSSWTFNMLFFIKFGF